MKLYREDQKYHDGIAIAMIVALSLLFISTLLTQAHGLWKIALGVVTVGAIVLLVTRLRLKIRIGKKKMSIRISPIPWSRVRLSKDEVTGIEFVKSAKAEIANGWAVHYGGKLRFFNFGDNKGMLIHRNDGGGIVVLSSKLYENRDKVVEELKSNGWVTT